MTVSDLSGPTSVTGVQVSDLLPAGMSFVSATASAGSYDSASGLWSIDSLALGGSETLQITARIAVGTAGQTLINTASLAFVDQGDINPANDSASVTFVVRPSADLALTLTAGNNSPREGRATAVLFSDAEQRGSWHRDGRSGDRPAARQPAVCQRVAQHGHELRARSPASGPSARWPRGPTFNCRSSRA